jgi:hypothetical protein
VADSIVILLVSPLEIQKKHSFLKKMLLVYY